MTGDSGIFNRSKSGSRNPHRVGARGQQLRAVAALSVTGSLTFQAFCDIADDYARIANNLSLRILHGHMQIAGRRSALSPGDCG